MASSFSDLNESRPEEKSKEEGLKSVEVSFGDLN